MGLRVSLYWVTISTYGANHKKKCAVHNRRYAAFASNFRKRRSEHDLLRALESPLPQLNPCGQSLDLGRRRRPPLQRQIEANEGLFEPLLVDPHPEFAGKYLPRGVTSSQAAARHRADERRYGYRSRSQDDSCGERLQQKSLPADVPGGHRLYTSSIFPATAHRESPIVDEKSVPKNYRYCRILWLYEPVILFACI